MVLIKEKAKLKRHGNVVDASPRGGHPPHRVPSRSSGQYHSPPLAGSQPDHEITLAAVIFASVLSSKSFFKVLTEEHRVHGHGLHRVLNQNHKSPSVTITCSKQVSRAAKNSAKACTLKNLAAVSQIPVVVDDAPLMARLILNVLSPSLWIRPTRLLF